MSNGKAAKKAKNEKEKKNQEIADYIMAYYLSEQEMPEYIAGVATSMQDHYKNIITGLTAHMGVMAANFKQIEKEVDASDLSKASKDRIRKWLDVSIIPEVDEQG